MRDRRLTSLIVPLGLLAVTAAELTLTPSEFFASPVYWAGVSVFGLNGLFIYGTTKRQSKLPKYGRYAFLLIIGGALALGRRYPTTITFAFGFAGFFVGLSLKITYVVIVETRYSYCPSCGAIGWLSKRQGKWYCDRMGHQVDLNEAQTKQELMQTIKAQPVTLRVDEADQPFHDTSRDEWFLGGFSSISLSKKPFTANYGVYATSRRVFGIVARPETGRDLREVVPRAVSKELSDLIIGELDRKKDFEIRREDIVNIELKRSPGIFRMGHLLICARSGQTVDVGLGKDKMYQQMRELMQAFYPKFTTS